MGNQKIGMTRFIAIYTLLWWLGTEPKVSLGVSIFFMIFVLRWLKTYWGREDRQHR